MLNRLSVGISNIGMLCLCGCAVGSNTGAEPTGAAPQVESSSPVTNVPTILTIEVDGEALTLPASARLELDIEDRIALSAATSTAGNLFSMRFRVPSDITKLRGKRFELTKGINPENELGIVRGELPNATLLRSVAGSARVLAFEEEKLEVSFDVMLSKDSDTGSDPIHATGKLTGVASLVCLEKGSALKGAQLEAANGQSQVIRSASLDDARCQPLVRMRDKN